MPIRGSGGDVEFGVRITADNQVFVNGVKASREELDKLGEGLKKVGAEAQGTTRSQESLTGAVFKGNLAMEAARIAGDTLVATWNTMREEARQNELQQIKLATVLEATSFASLKTAAQIESLSDRMANATFFDKNKIQDAATQLLTFERITGDTFDRVMKAGANLATLFGGDLTNQTLRVARALTEPGTSLGALEREVGKFSPELRVLVKNLAEMGDVSGAQSLILAELDRKLGKVSETIKTGLRGEVDNLTKAWKDLLGAIGSGNGGFFSDAGVAILGGITQGLKGIKGVIESGDWWQKLMLLYNPAAAIGMQKPFAGARAEGRDNAAELEAERQAAERFRQEMLAQDDELTRVALANTKKREDAQKRSWADLSKTWVEFIDESIEQDKRLGQVLHENAKDREKDRVKLAEEAAKAALKVEEIAIDDLTEAWTFYFRFLEKERQKQIAPWKGFLDGIENAFRATWDAFGQGSKKAAEVAKDAFKRTFFDWLYQVVAKPITLQIVASLAGLLGMNGLAQAAQNSLGGGNNWLSTIFQGAVNWLGSTSWGQTMTNAVSTFGSSVSSFASAVSGYVAVAAAMLWNDSAYRQGWRVENQDSTARASSRWLAAGLPGPYEGDRFLRGLGLNDRWASLLSGSSLLTRFFGHGPVHGDAWGVRGSITGQNVGAMNWQDFSRRGGYFRSDQRWTEADSINTGQLMFLNRQMAAVSGMVGRFASWLGVNPGSALSGYSRDFSIQMSDNGEPISPEEAARRIAEVFVGALQDQVEIVLRAGGRAPLADFIGALSGSPEQIAGTINAVLGLVDSVESLGDAITMLEGGPVDAIRMTLRDLDRDVTRAQSAFDAALASGDPEAILAAERELTGAVMSRYQREIQMVRELEQAIRAAEEQAYQFALNIGGRINAVGGSRDLGAIAMGRATTLRGRIGGNAPTMYQIEDLQGYVGAIDTWYNARRQSIMDDINRQNAALQAQAAAQQAAAQARISQLQAELELAQSFKALAERAGQMINDMRLGSSNPMSIYGRIGMAGEDVAALRATWQSATGQARVDAANRLLEALQTWRELGMQGHQRPSAEWQAIYNAIMGDLTAVQEDAQSFAERELEIQQQILAVQTDSAAIQAQLAGSMITTNAELEALNREALGYYTWAETEGQRLFALHQQGYREQLTAITGGQDVQLFIADRSRDAARDLAAIRTAIERWLQTPGTPAGGQQPPPGDTTTTTTTTDGNGLGRTTINVVLRNTRSEILETVSLAAPQLAPIFARSRV